MNEKELNEFLKNKEIREAIQKEVLRLGPVNFYKNYFTEEEMTDELKNFIEKFENPNL
ncbi:MAG: hypothetical protein IK134_08360 [Oscillospiraceae bacterium]|nr:hypothetical protein [Oscillospiraceae bacterium]